MRWPPLVSARYAEFLEKTVERLQRERDEQQERADRAMDNLAMTYGHEPSTPRVREELKEAQSEVEEFLTSMEVEDPHAGMLSAEIVALAEAEGADPAKQN